MESTLRKLPPKIKIYEALWAIADHRVELEGLLWTQGKCYSASTKGKSYTISYDPETNVIVSNDSGSTNQGYLGYPAVAFLLKMGKLPYDPQFLIMLKAINWQEIKEQVNKDHEATLRVLLGMLFQEGFDVDALAEECDRIEQELENLKVKKE